MSVSVTSTSYYDCVDPTTGDIIDISAGNTSTGTSSIPYSNPSKYNITVTSTSDQDTFLNHGMNLAIQSDSTTNLDLIIGRGFSVSASNSSTTAALATLRRAFTVTLGVTSTTTVRRANPVDAICNLTSTSTIDCVAGLWKKVNITTTSTSTANTTFSKIGPVNVNLTVTSKTTVVVSAGRDIVVNAANASTTSGYANYLVGVIARASVYSPVITGSTPIPQFLERTVVNNVTLTKDAFTLELPKPVFGDIDGLDLNVSIQTTLNGDLVIKPLVSPTYKRVWAFENLCEDDRINIEAFTTATLGQVITITDYESYTTNAIITSSPKFVNTNTGWDYTMEFDVV